MRFRFIAVAVTVLGLHLSAPAEGQDLQLQRGNELLERGDFAAAERLFRDALSAEPGNLVYRSQLGLVLIRQKRHEEAERELRQVLSQDPNEVGTLWYLALNSYFAGSYREAATRFKRVVPMLDRRSGQYYSAHWFIGTCWETVLLRKQADVTSAITGGAGPDQAGLSHPEVDEMIDAYKKYLDLQPRAPDRSSIEQFLTWVAKNRPPANVTRWIIVNQP